MSKIPSWLLVLVFGCVLLVPMLGSYGLWDPIEIQHADVAQEVAKSGSFRDVTVGGKFSPRPVLYIWIVAASFKVLGVSELAGRLPLALCGVLALLLAFRVSRRLFSERAGIIAAFVLATTPTFLFQSRQLVSDLPFYVSLLASVGGLAAFLWPADGRRRRLDLLIGGLGLVGGFLARGVALGALFPVVCLALAIALSWRTRHTTATSGIWPASDGPDLKIGATMGDALRGAFKPLLGALGAAIALIVVLFFVLRPQAAAQARQLAWYLLLGGEYRRIEVPPTLETMFRDLGFGFFPWFALVPMALGRCVLAQRIDPEATDPQRPHAAFPQMLALVVSVAGYVAGAVAMGYIGNLRYPGLPWLAVAVGLLVHELWVAPDAPHRLWGVLGAGLLLSIQMDYFMDPQSLAFSHLTDPAKYPIDLDIKLPVRIFGITLSLLFFLALGGVPSPIRADFRGRYLGAVARGLGWIVDQIGDLLRMVCGPTGKHCWYAIGVAALGFAGWCGFYLLPSLSLHLSNKALFQTFHNCRTGEEKLAQYQVPGRGAAYYNRGQVDDVRDQNQLFSLLREPRRWFILMPSSYLASIDQAARQAHITYHVLDDRNSQYLMISNRLSGRCNRDLNPLRRYVLSSPPKVGKPVVANFENKVKLLGYDVGDAVTRGGKFRITLYFQVLDRMPAGYKLFIHFDQPANRFHGDHDPLDGKFPTQYWLPGDYIVDPHDVEIPLITTPSGTYEMFMGFWLGEGRLKVIEGPNDGVNRVRLGNLRVR